MDRQSRAMKSGAAATKVPKCKFYNELAFLTDKTANRPTETNINTSKDIIGEQDSCTQSSCGIAGAEEVITGTKRKTQETVGKSPNKYTKSSKARADMDYALDTMIVKTLHDMEKPNLENESTNVDGDSLFCKSLIPILKSLSPKKNRQAKCRIQQMLYELEFDETD